MSKTKSAIEYLSWYLGAGVYGNGNYTLIARDDDFSKFELVMVGDYLKNRGLNYELNQNQIKILNENS